MKSDPSSFLLRSASIRLESPPGHVCQISALCLIDSDVILLSQGTPLALCPLFSSQCPTSPSSGSTPSQSQGTITRISVHHEQPSHRNESGRRSGQPHKKHYHETSDSAACLSYAEIGSWDRAESVENRSRGRCHFENFEHGDNAGRVHRNRGVCCL